MKKFITQHICSCFTSLLGLSVSINIILQQFSIGFQIFILISPRSQNDWEVFYCQAWHLLFHRRRYDTIFCFLFFSFIFLLLRLTSKCAIESLSHGVSCYICILSYKKKYYYTLWEHLWIWNLKCNISEYFKSERFYAFFISSINLSQDS